MIPSSSQISAMNASFPDGDGEDVSSSGSRKCDCGLDAKLRTSTTVRNPGRRFYGCPNFVVFKFKLIFSNFASVSSFQFVFNFSV